MISHDPNTTATTSSVMSGHPSASTPKMMPVAPNAASAMRASQPRPRRNAPTIPAAPLTSSRMPVITATARTVSAGHSSTKTPTPTQPAARR